METDMRQFAIAVSIMLLTLSCQKESPEQAAALAQVSSPPVSRGTVPATADRSGVDVKQSGENIEIRYPGGVLTGDPRSTGKRKYRVGNGPVTYEVKPGEGGFKLRTADGALRWKVKISADKIKISDNEENRNPFELKRRENGEVKVVAPGEREIGRVSGTAAQAVLLVDAIPEIERYILMAELTARKQ
jgi:hypothetical protein